MTEHHIKRHTVNHLLVNMVQKTQSLTLEHTVVGTDPSEKEEIQNVCAESETTGRCCREHRRILELFCQEDETFVCAQCVPKHSTHSFVSLQEAFSVYKDKLKAAILFLASQVKGLKDLQNKQEKAVTDVQDNTHCLEQYITAEFAKLHKFLQDQEHKLIKQLDNEAAKTMKENIDNTEGEFMASLDVSSDIKRQISDKAEILKHMGKGQNCSKNEAVDAPEVVPTFNLEIKREAELVKEMKKDLRCSEKDVVAIQEALSDVNLEHGVQGCVGFLAVPETFEDVAITFSEEEWKMLSKPDKELHREVMVQNYETLVSVGYKIPQRKLLLLFKADKEDPGGDVKMKNTPAQKDHLEDNPSINRFLKHSKVQIQQSAMQNHLNSKHNKDYHDKMQVCNEEKWYKCAMCGTSFAFKYALKIHQQGHCEEKLYTCSTCGKSFTRKSNHSAHEKIHTREKPCKCTTCGKRFAQKSSLLVHEKIHSGEKPYKCDTCDKSFTQKATLLTHQKIHTGDRSYKCVRCDRSFSFRSTLLIHEKIHSGEKPYKCASCSKSFLRKDQLSMHEQTHIEEKPYKCASCDKSYVRKDHLLVHEKTHTGEKPYKCAMCGKGFTHKSSFSAHEKIHTGEKPHKCATCGKSFIQKSSLSMHEKIHVGEKQYKCATCDRSFTQKIHLIRHMNKHTRV